MGLFGTDLTHILLYTVFLGGVVGIALYILTNMGRQLRGTFGRPYTDVVEDMFAEGQRRAELMARVAELREARLARLERRLEGGH